MLEGMGLKIPRIKSLDAEGVTRGNYQILSELRTFSEHRSSCSCSWNVHSLIFQDSDFQNLPGSPKSNQDSFFIKSQNAILRTPEQPEQPFSDYIDYSLPCLIMGKMVEIPINPCLKSLGAEGAS